MTKNMPKTGGKSMSALHNMMTGKDNQTHDVVRVVLTIFAFMFPAIMLWGIVMSTLAFFWNKNFDMQSAFVGIMAFVTGVGAFLTGGGAAIWLKRSTEPDGSSTETESVEKER
jgi:hypothetical protein